MADVAKARRQAFLQWMGANKLNGNRIATATGLPYTTINSYVVGKTNSFGGDVEAIIARAYGLPVEAIFGFGIDEAGSVQRQPNYLKAWREQAGLTLEQAAAQLGTTVPVVEGLEGGEYSISDKWYRAFAPIYKTTPGHLMDHDPKDIPADILDLAARMKPEDRERLARIAEALQTGTNG